MRPHPTVMLMGGAQAPFTISASPATATAGGGFDGNAKTTNTVTTALASGPAGFTYTEAWTLVGGSGVIIGSSSSTGSNFTANPGENSTITATARCTWTRSDGAKAFVDVPVTITAGAAQLTVVVSPNGNGGNLTFSHPATSAWSGSFSASVSGGNGSYSESWSGSGGTVSPSAGSSTTFTVQPGAAGTQSTVNINCSASDTGGHTGQAGQVALITWT